MATIRDVAQEAGLSTGTVSKVLSHPEKVSKKNQIKVHEAIAKLNYKPNMLAQKFRSKRSNTIVVMVPDIANLFFAKVISGIETVAQASGFSVLLGDTKDSLAQEKEFIKMVETRLADGVINLRPYRKSDALLPKDGVLSVAASSCENTPSYSVRIDNVGASVKVINHLLSLGHKRIGVISGLKNNPHTIDRLKGYKQAIAEAGIDYDPSIVIEGDFNYWSGLSAAEQFCKMTDRPTAICCFNDEMAIAAIKGFSEKGLKVPQDISITGFDDMDVSKYIIPTLTTVAQPAEKMGERSAELLLALINEDTPSATEHILPYEFVIRESTAPPRH
ncbi:LacI family DNA-binding transcriptional regulator [Alteromonas oceanisediminis]|uniref:LacI family DNA-binding transcriptional regulator n=1 Tax=Alteromonas oceanisediminis TaxID=2836180 RepID=UPI001BDB0934|nr:LacI family DNA-binding transcriptional regulator [Alteromonas oceanisediminis]MBT0586819.1 LacI family transcriptional regulator [Alteromonas oceanisediminis]